MNCEKFEKWIPDYIAGSLDEHSRRTLEAHMAACERCRKEVSSISALWTNLGMLPEAQPSENMRARFFTALEAYQHGLEQGKQRAHFKDWLNGWFLSWWPKQPAIQFGMAFVLLIVGFFLGNQSQFGGGSGSEVRQLREDFTQMQRLVALSMLDQQSPIDRLKGVTFSYRLQKPDRQVVDALLNTLNRDPSVNVRLAALDALLQFSEQDEVREGLIASLANQSSPMVQVALIDLLVEIQEKQSLGVLNNFASGDSINTIVKERATRGIELLREDK